MSCVMARGQRGPWGDTCGKPGVPWCQGGSGDLERPGIKVRPLGCGMPLFPRCAGRSLVSWRLVPWLLRSLLLPCCYL